VLGAYQRPFGLELEHLAVDGCTTKAPCGGQVARPSPVDRRKQGLKRSVLTTDAGGVPLGAVAAPANRRNDGLLARPLTPSRWSGCCPPDRCCTWTPVTTTRLPAGAGRAERGW
jgi:hypothetical protein